MSGEEGEAAERQDLERLWKQEIAANVDSESTAIFDWWARLTAQYAENARTYFNLEFLDNKAKWFYEIKDELKSPTAVACAIIFQYFEYEPQSEDWREKNSEHFKEFATEVQLDDDKTRTTIELLDASKTSITEEHQSEGAYGSEDIHFFLDLDMVYLGADAPEYRAQSDKMRQEYSFLRSDQYNTSQIKDTPKFSIDTQHLRYIYIPREI
ncbi:unnamed protein product [Bemisia tabaci]|uniref:Uncharacterized protein n=1 Tax=Bemisia tabaci TaxID=7038 RepID=A0A9P0AJP5_BEMTA|nr:unnamed protein product [Bemisia tabaci]